MYFYKAFHFWNIWAPCRLKLLYFNSISMRQKHFHSVTGELNIKISLPRPGFGLCDSITHQSYKVVNRAQVITTAVGMEKSCSMGQSVFLLGGNSVGSWTANQKHRVWIVWVSAEGSCPGLSHLPKKNISAPLVLLLASLLHTALPPSLQLLEAEIQRLVPLVDVLSFTFCFFFSFFFYLGHTGCCVMRSWKVSSLLAMGIHGLWSPLEKLRLFFVCRRKNRKAPFCFSFYQNFLFFLLVSHVIF